MQLVGLYEAQIMSGVAEWMRRPDEPFICVLPYLFECYSCDGQCDHAVFQNAVEMRIDRLEPELSLRRSSVLPAISA